MSAAFTDNETWNSTAHPTPFNAGKYASIWTAFGLLAILGLSANTLMVTILFRMKMTSFHVIVTGLCFTDILSSCNSPLYVYVIQSIDDFKFPLIVCTLPLAVDLLTTIATIYHVLLLSYIRFRGVVYAISSRGEMNRRKCIRLVLASWLVAAAATIPLFFILHLEQTSSENIACDFHKENGGLWLYLLITSLTVGIPIPTLLVIGLCLTIIIFLATKKKLTNTKSNSAASRHRESQVFRQLAIMIISFFIGYGVAFGTAIYMTAFNDKSSEYTSPSLVSHSVIRVTGCLNPFMYYLGSSEIRHATAQTLTAVGKTMEFPAKSVSDRKSNVMKLREGAPTNSGMGETIV